jgi:hypothetical protein
MTTDRREFLHHAAGALTGAAFTGCGVMGAAFSQTPALRREVVSTENASEPSICTLITTYQKRTR